MFEPGDFRIVPRCQARSEPPLSGAPAARSFLRRNLEGAGGAPIMRRELDFDLNASLK
jgi:hypothetical protein